MYDANDNVTQATAPNGAISTNVYDNADQLISSKAPKDLATDPDRETKYEYDVVGNLLRQTEPKGSLTPDGVKWRTLYTQSLQVSVELTPANGDVRVWAHEGSQRGDIFISPPIDSPIISNLQWGADLGTSVLGALHRSSTTGWVGPYPE